MERARIGIIGCGAIARIQYLPLLRELRDRFEIAGLCDLSREVMTILGDEYGVPASRWFTDYRELAASEIDAVIVCTTGSHAEPAIAAARAGKHLLVEKPMATTEADAAAMVDAADRAGVTLMVGYMKRHDPAYRFAAERARAMRDIRFVQVNHLHPDNRVHLAKFAIHRPSDLPAASPESIIAAENEKIGEALGMPAERVPAVMRRAFFATLYSMIHDIGNLSGLFGQPRRVASTEIWAGGNCLTTVLEYEAGFRAVASWIDLPDLPAFEETLEVYGSRERVIVSFPTGFSIGLPSTVALHGMDEESRPWRQEYRWNENPFRNELLHFHDCIVNGAAPLTPGRDAIGDIALVREIVLAAR